MDVLKACRVVLGVIMVGLGTAGIVLPLLPTTPFLLLAAYLFAKSSRRWHDWLLNQKHLGPYLHAWRNKSGLTITQKLRIGISFTVVMGISTYFSPIPAIRWLLVGIWAFWTVMLLRQRTVADAEKPPHKEGTVGTQHETAQPRIAAPQGSPT